MHFIAAFKKSLINTYIFFYLIIIYFSKYNGKNVHPF